MFTSLRALLLLFVRKLYIFNKYIIESSIVPQVIIALCLKAIYFFLDILLILNISNNSNIPIVVLKT